MVAAIGARNHEIRRIVRFLSESLETPFQFPRSTLLSILRSIYMPVILARMNGGEIAQPEKEPAVTSLSG